MSWKNQSGGPWGGGPRGPWGSGQQPGPGRGSGNQPPDLEELIRRGQDKLKNVLPGSGNFGGRGALILVFAVIVIWLLSGFYRVNTDEQGIVLRFGKFVQTTQPGLNYHLPYPIETVLTPRVTFENKIDIGFREQQDFRRGTITRDVAEESLILTGDENIVDVDFSVFWIINNAGRYLFNLQNPEGTIKAVAESAMREVIGRAQIQPILTGARAATEQEVLKLMQKILDGYQAGITVTRVQMQKVDPPSQVIDAFRDVQAARADAERLQNEAQTYANRVVPEARGEAARILQAADAYKERTVVEAKGQAARFLSILAEYKLAPEVTRRRMYLETMERVLGGIDKVILDPSNKGSNVVPYLPLDQLLRQTPQGGARR
ncbi:MAG: FtsH protease activity modulator HflK [Xanthobacteraceae bacterium]|nr:FtsH protease activity modulator HflK [Xanthobacteraceae bacterium]